MKKRLLHCLLSFAVIAIIFAGVQAPVVAAPDLSVDLITNASNYATGVTAPNTKVAAYKYYPVANGKTYTYEGKQIPLGDKSYLELGSAYSDVDGKFSIPIGYHMDSTFIKIAVLSESDEELTSYEQMVRYALPLDIDYSATSAKAGSVYGSGYEAGKMIDGATSTRWASRNKTTWIEVSFGAAMTFDTLVLNEYKDSGVTRITDYTISINEDGSWKQIVEGHTNIPERLNLGTSVTTDALRIDILAANAAPSIYEIGLADSKQVYYGEYEDIDDILNWIKESSFNFYWDSINHDKTSHGYGLPGSAPNTWAKEVCGIGAVGHALNSLIIGAEYEYKSREEIEEVVLGMMNALWNYAPQQFGLFRGQFSTWKTDENGMLLPLTMGGGVTGQKTDFSTSDTGQAVGGILAAGEYFGGEIRELANKIYERMDFGKVIWPHKKSDGTFYYQYTSYSENYPGRYPSETDFPGITGNFPDQSNYNLKTMGLDRYWNWGFSSEAFNVYFYDAANPAHDNPYVYDMFYNAKKGGQELPVVTYTADDGTVMGPVVSLYDGIHNLWTLNLDLRNKADERGINYMQELTNSYYITHQYAMDKTDEYRTFNEFSWGTTATSGPLGYMYWAGQAPGLHYDEEGTVVPSVAIGCLPFTPDISLPTIENYYKNFPSLWHERWGFYSSYNIDHNFPGRNMPYYSAGYFSSLEKMVQAPAVENYQTGLIWKYTMRNENIQLGMERLGFLSTEPVKNVTAVVTPGDGQLTVELTGVDEVLANNDYQFIYVYDEAGDGQLSQPNWNQGKKATPLTVWKMVRATHIKLSE
ncbi:glucoamylase family protein [Culicoidibacter larvae]|uniref:F5/8 type C domain-containing protein n=1 Tax=Culicoidibacter larvae TaxID=2579976 RepID=A0A5R8QI69_9FIRM|nr:glucoamylase family protein [Culicoidibacter larvae]TLG77494.1 hypothetical protein FEZ08_02410 [Culicoidibacter larvae]